MPRTPGERDFSTRRDLLLAAGARSAEVLLPMSGSWLVVLTHRSHSEGEDRWVSSGLGSQEALIEVQPDSPTQDFAFTVDAAAAAAAVQRP